MQLRGDERAMHRERVVVSLAIILRAEEAWAIAASKHSRRVDGAFSSGTRGVVAAALGAVAFALGLMMGRRRWREGFEKEEAR